MLARRLGRFQVGIAGVAIGALFANDLAKAGVSTVLSAIETTRGFATGAATENLISPEVLTLTQGVLNNMHLTKLKLFSAILLLTVVVVAATAGLSYSFLAPAHAGDQPVAAAQQPVANSSDKTPSQSVKPASEPEKRDGKTVLASLKTRLERETRELKPAPTFDLREKDKSLAFRYKTRDYLVYPGNKTGRLARDPEKREGPDDDGVFLWVSVQRKGELNQVAVPQTIAEAYWTTYLDIYPIAATEEQFYFTL